MLYLVPSPVMAQGPILSGLEAVAIARKRFANLCGEGILSRHGLAPFPWNHGKHHSAAAACPMVVGTPIDLDDVEAALAFLRQCRKTEVAIVNGFELRSAIGGQLGATFAAASALGFDVCNYYGGLSFGAHARIAVNRVDVRRVAGGGRDLHQQDRNYALARTRARLRLIS
jgi:hypothetical protein